MSKRMRPTKYDYNMDVREQRPFESDLDYYKALARQANARLTRIEKYSQEPNYKGMIKYAYRNAQYDIKKITGNESATRFTSDIPLTKEGKINQSELRRRTNAATRFLESPTSTKTGIKAVYERRAKTVNQRYGWEIGSDGKRHRRKDWQNLTWEDMARYYESDHADAADKKYGSKTEIRALGAIKRISNNPKQMSEAIKGNIKLSDDAAVNEAAKNMLQNGLDPQILFK